MIDTFLRDDKFFWKAQIKSWESITYFGEIIPQKKWKRGEIWREFHKEHNSNDNYLIT